MELPVRSAVAHAAAVPPAGAPADLHDPAVPPVGRCGLRVSLGAPRAHFEGEPAGSSLDRGWAAPGQAPVLWLWPRTAAGPLTTWHLEGLVWPGEPERTLRWGPDPGGWGRLLFEGSFDAAGVPTLPAFVRGGEAFVLSEWAPGRRLVDLLGRFDWSVSPP